MIAHPQPRPLSTLGSLAVALLSLLVIGCGGDASSIAAIGQAVQTASRAGGLDTPQPDSQSEPNAAQKVAFTPPHPDRIDPFVYPYQDDDAVSTPSGATSARQIKVLGFANLDIPRVMIRIGDQTKILKAGDSTAGVEVVSIHPPMVELKMDNLTWTATMFDDKSR